MVWNRTSRGFRAAGANAGKAVVDAGTGGVLEAIPRGERSWLAIVSRAEQNQATVAEYK
jgi:hypothetical protein